MLFLVVSLQFTHSTWFPAFWPTHSGRCSILSWPRIRNKRLRLNEVHSLHLIFFPACCGGKKAGCVALCTIQEPLKGYDILENMLICVLAWTVRWEGRYHAHIFLKSASSLVALYLSDILYIRVALISSSNSWQEGK